MKEKSTNSAQEEALRKSSTTNCEIGSLPFGDGVIGGICCACECIDVSVLVTGYVASLLGGMALHLKMLDTSTMENFKQKTVRKVMNWAMKRGIRLSEEEVRKMLVSELDRNLKEENNGCDENQ